MRRCKTALLLAAFLASACASMPQSAVPTQRAVVAAKEPLRALVARTGAPAIPRYIRYRELDPRNPVRVLLSPTLQRGRLGRPIVLDPAIPYLYSVAADGTFLVAEKRGFASNAQCGHPNLTQGRAARMSGELNYDPRREAFVIDNDSGRYGFQLSRRRGQLEAAAELLRRIGVRSTSGATVELALRWIAPRRGARYAALDQASPRLKGAPASLDSASWRRRILGVIGAERSASKRF